MNHCTPPIEMDGPYSMQRRIWWRNLREFALNLALACALVGFCIGLVYGLTS